MIPHQGTAEIITLCQVQGLFGSSSSAPAALRTEEGWRWFPAEVAASAGNHLHPQGEVSEMPKRQEGGYFIS